MTAMMALMTTLTTLTMIIIILSGGACREQQCPRRLCHRCGAASQVDNYHHYDDTGYCHQYLVYRDDGQGEAGEVVRPQEDQAG